MCISPIIIKGEPVACRKCVECLINEATQWSYRCMLEASLYKENCFITLTYNDANRPKDGYLSKKDYQDFLKRFRKRLGTKRIRYFGCGEYGSKFNRPHYHFIIFGYRPDDLEYFFTDKQGCKIYKSEFIYSVWKKGFITVGDVSFDTVKYCAKYLQKLRPEVKDYKVKPFCCMSRKPALGFGAVNEKMLETDKIYIDGKTTRLPDTFIKKAFSLFPDMIVKLKFNRKKHCYSLFSDDPFLYHNQLDNEFKVNYNKEVYYNYLTSKKKKYRKLLQGIKKS